MIHQGSPPPDITVPVTGWHGDISPVTESSPPPRYVTRTPRLFRAAAQLVVFVVHATTAQLGKTAPPSHTHQLAEAGEQGRSIFPTEHRCSSTSQPTASLQSCEENGMQQVARWRLTCK